MSSRNLTDVPKEEKTPPQPTVQQILEKLKGEYVASQVTLYDRNAHFFIATIQQLQKQVEDLKEQLRQTNMTRQKKLPPKGSKA